MSLLGAVSVGCGLGVVAVTARWARRRRDGLGRPRPFPMWTVFVLASGCVLALIPGVLRHRAEARLSQAASTMVGHPVHVHCQTTTSALVDVTNELGFVPYDRDGVPEPQTLIKRDACNALRKYLGSSKGHPSREEVVAVHVLTHESMHMRGETSEAKAECEAVQRDRTMAGLLGATPIQAYRLSIAYWITVYPDMPDGYFSTDCAPGGPLDEHLPSAPWLRYQS